MSNIKYYNSFLGYFKFYYSIIGVKLIINLLLCIFVAFLDGVGLAMFMPLLQAFSDPANVDNHRETMGKLYYVTDFITYIGFDLNLETILLFIALLFVFKALVRFVQFNYEVRNKHTFVKKIRISLIDKLQAISFQGFTKLDSGRILNTFTGEILKLIQGMTAYIYASQSAVILITYIFLAFLANAHFALLVAIGAYLSNFIYKKIYKAVKSASLEVSKQAGDFNGYLVQAVQHFKYLKSTNTFDTYASKLKKITIMTESLNKKIGFYSAFSMSVREPLIIVIVIIVILFQVNWMGEPMASILLSLLLFYRALTYLMVAQQYWQTFIQNIGSMKTVLELNGEMDGMEEKLNATPYRGIDYHLHLRDISFRYGHKKILNKINLTIPKNSTVAFVGESGSGKTTIANIIAGLIHASEGNVMIDNRSLYDFNLNQYRNRVGYISQDPVVFNDDIYNNVTLWAEPSTVNVKKFWNIMDLVSLTQFVNDLPFKEKSELGDNGVLISGGQKQRISIARELFKDIDILILDEATSALDSETELFIQENIEKLHGSYTMIIIAHRLSTIKKADIIYLLDAGEIVAYGTFEEVLGRSERFKRMVSLQGIN